ncbi:MAG: helix-turn-helix domain-containing protein [Treponema sp.]|jgi:AraC-like DNA-binding protein|nr:helix-turn-helix domain-containing protein [Treponema sp.]
MVTEDKSAESAAYEAGYDSPTQFNREYKRQFGEPPRRDIERSLMAAAVLQNRGKNAAGGRVGELDWL